MIAAITEQDYGLIASVLRERRTAYNDVPSTLSVESQRLLESAVLVVDETARDLADLFAREDPLFNRDYFLTAIGVPR